MLPEAILPFAYSYAGFQNVECDLSLRSLHPLPLSCDRWYFEYLLSVLTKLDHCCVQRRSHMCLQVWVSWKMLSAIFHRREDIFCSQQRHLTHLLRHIMRAMYIEAHLQHEAKVQAARYQQMQIVPVMYRPWLVPHDCLVLTWQQMTKALSWRQVVQIMVSLHSLHVQAINFVDISRRLCYLQHQSCYAGDSTGCC